MKAQGAQTQALMHAVRLPTRNGRSMSPVAIKLDSACVTPEFDHPRPERRVSGNPQRTTWNQYTNASGEVYAGIWDCEPGAWRIEMGPTEDELFTVLHGECQLIAECGNTVHCGAGESLLIPAGFRGVFEVLTALRKHYLIVERRSSNTES
jgi:hypothetical protein